MVMKNLLLILNFIRTLDTDQTAAFLRLLEGIGSKEAPQDWAFNIVAADSGDFTGGLTNACRCADLLEVGDVVVLASGGPSMTISVIDDTHATVMWFDDDEDLCERRMPLAVLEHAPPSDE